MVSSEQGDAGSAAESRLADVKRDRADSLTANATACQAHGERNRIPVGALCSLTRNNFFAPAPEARADKDFRSDRVPLNLTKQCPTS